MANELPQKWRHDIACIMMCGKMLQVKIEELSSEDFKKFCRANLGMDVSSAYKVIGVSKHPILSDAKNWPKLPDAWGTLYELGLMDQDELLAKLESGSLKQVVKYEIWDWRSKTRTNRPKGRTSGIKVAVPDGLSVSDLTQQGIKLEGEKNLKIEEAAAQLGIGRTTYRRMRNIMLLANNPNLSPSHKEMVTIAINEINRTRNVGRYYQKIAPIIRTVWGDHSHRLSKNDKTAKRRIEQVHHTATVIATACGTAIDLEIPPMPREAIGEIINDLTTARQQLGRFIDQLRRQL